MTTANAEAPWLVPEPLTAAGWADFGWLPVDDTDPADREHRLEFEWGDPHVNIIGHLRSEVPAVRGGAGGPAPGAPGFRCEMAYRHLTHTQTIMPLDVECLLVVAPPGVAFDDPADVGRLRAFVLEPLEAVVLSRGTWHWGPFPTRADEVRLFNVQGFGYAEDNEMVDLAGRGMAVDVAVDVATR
jgi:ureidoglycolate hydrolase